MEIHPRNEISRANDRVVGVSFLPLSLKYAEVNGTYYGAPKAFIFLDASCSPSMKISDVWDIRIIFERSLGADPNIKFKWVKGPDSKCFCPNGLFFCSHTMGFFMLLAGIQRNTMSYNISTFMNFVLVPNIRTLLQSHPSYNILAHCVSKAKKVKSEGLKEEDK